MDTRRERFKRLITSVLTNFNDLKRALSVYDQIEFACCEDFPSMVLLAGLRKEASGSTVDLAVYEVMKLLR